MSDPETIPGPSDLPKLAAALRELDDRSAPAVPASVDEAVMAATRQAVAPRPNVVRPATPRIQWLVPLAAAAAVVGIVTFLNFTSMEAPRTGGQSEVAHAPAAPAPPPVETPAPTTVLTEPLRGDLDQDRQVTIIDALLLAQLVERGEAATADHVHDVNGDGLEDFADVEALSQIAVTPTSGAFFDPVQPAPVVDPAPTAPVRFVTVDLWVDAGDQRCASWQIEFAAEVGDVRLVGIEGGERPWTDAPTYDPRALKSGRVIVAAFTTKPKVKAGRVRVARLQLRVAGGLQPQFVAKLQAASDPDGRRIDATVTVNQGE